MEKLCIFSFNLQFFLSATPSGILYLFRNPVVSETLGNALLPRGIQEPSFLKHATISASALSLSDPVPDIFPATTHPLSYRKSQKLLYV